MIGLEEQLCPWKLSREITERGGEEDSWFHWVHPWSYKMYVENKRKYALVEWYKVSNRRSYPAYSVTELSYLIFDTYCTLGWDTSDGWYCKDALDCKEDLVYCRTPVEACACYYIRVLKEIEEDKREEVRIKERGLV